MEDFGIEKSSMPMSLKSTKVHPLEEAQSTYRERQEKGNYRMAAKTFGLGFALHLKHERAATSCPQIGHLGMIARHNAMHESLTGRDLDFDFNDTLAIEPECNLSSHRIMDTFQSHPLCPK